MNSHERRRRLAARAGAAVVGIGIVATALTGCANTMDAADSGPSVAGASASVPIGQPVTFTSTNGGLSPYTAYTWTVPLGVTTVNIAATGGGGGAGFTAKPGGAAGGSGALVTSSSVPVTPGTQFKIEVGAGGSDTGAGGRGGVDSLVQGPGFSVDAGGGGGGGLGSEYGVGGAAGALPGGGGQGIGGGGGGGVTGGTAGSNGVAAGGAANGGGGAAGQGASGSVRNGASGLSAPGGEAVMASGGGWGFGGGGAGSTAMSGNGQIIYAGGGGGGSTGPTSNGITTTYAVANNGGAPGQSGGGGVVVITPMSDGSLLPPTNAAATASGSTVSMNWQDPVQPSTQSDVYYGIVLVSPTGSVIGQASDFEPGRTTGTVTAAYNTTQYYAAAAFNPQTQQYSTSWPTEVQGGAPGSTPKIIQSQTPAPAVKPEASN